MNYREQFDAAASQAMTTGAMADARRKQYPLSASGVSAASLAEVAVACRAAEKAWRGAGAAAVAANNDAIWRKDWTASTQYRAEADDALKLAGAYASHAQGYESKAATVALTEPASQQPSTPPGGVEAHAPPSVTGGLPMLKPKAGTMPPAPTGTTPPSTVPNDFPICIGCGTDAPNWQSPAGLVMPSPGLPSWVLPATAGVAVLGGVFLLLRRRAAVAGLYGLGHPGGLDRTGCHVNYRTGRRHCHKMRGWRKHGLPWR